MCNCGGFTVPRSYVAMRKQRPAPPPPPPPAPAVEPELEHAEVPGG